MNEARKFPFDSPLVEQLAEVLYRHETGMRDAAIAQAAKALEFLDGKGLLRLAEAQPGMLLTFTVPDAVRMAVDGTQKSIPPLSIWVAQYRPLKEAVRRALGLISPDATLDPPKAGYRWLAWKDATLDPPLDQSKTPAELDLALNATISLDLVNVKEKP